MRPWLLLASLLVSDLSPLGDSGQDWVMENYSWSLYRKLLLNGQMTPLGLEILQTQTEHHCMCIQRNCVRVAVQHKQRTSPFYWTYTVHDDHGCSLSHWEFTGIIHRNHIPALVVYLLHEEGEIVPAFRVKSDTLPALHTINEITSTKAGGEASHIALDIIKDHPDSGSAWLLHPHTAASGHNFQAFLLEKPKIWVPATIVQLQKMLTKRHCAATTAIISCCFKEGEIRSAVNIKKISKEQIAQPQIRQTESTQRPMDIKVLVQYDGQRASKAVVSQHDIFQAATLHSGSSSVTTSDISQLEIQKNAVRIIKKNEHLNLDDESLLQKRVQKQHSLKAASSVYDNDGFNVERQAFLVSRKKTESINRPQYKIKATQGDNKEDFSGKIITKQAELRRPEGESETELSHTNTIEKGNQKRLAYILQADLTHKTDNKDVNNKQMLTEVGEEVLIMLLPPATERETHRKLILTDTGWKTVNIPIKELDDPPPMTGVIKDNLNSKCKLKEIHFSFELYALAKTKRMDIKPAESTAKVTTVSAYTEDKTKETTEKTEHTPTNNTPQDNTSINHTKQEEESIIPSPPSLEIMKTETARTEHIAETTTANMETIETTSSTKVFNQGSTQKEGRLPSTEETPTTTMRSETNNNIQATAATTEKSFSGLRMREDIPAADTPKLHEGAENEVRAATNRPQNERKEDQNDPTVNSLTFAKPLQTIHQQDTEFPKATDDNMPLCRGLIHRTEAGWKHCVQRSNMFSSREPTDAFKDTGEQETEHRDHKNNILDDDECNHFYYSDGVLRRVQINFYPYYKRQRRRKCSHDNTENSVFTVRKKENLLSYIQRLTLRNKASHFKL